MAKSSSSLIFILKYSTLGCALADQESYSIRVQYPPSSYEVDRRRAESTNQRKKEIYGASVNLMSSVKFLSFRILSMDLDIRFIKG